MPSWAPFVLRRILVDNKTVLALLEGFMNNNPNGSLRILVLAKPIRAFLNANLSEQELAWFVNDLNTRPSGLIDFINSETGKKLVKEVLAVYAASLQPTPAVPQSTEKADAFSALT